MSKKDKAKQEAEAVVDEKVRDTVEESAADKGDTGISEVEQLKENLASEKDKFMRLFAEFENYKKRTSKERIELFKTASRDVMTSLIPVLDDFERALKHMKEDKASETVLQGVDLIYNKFKSALENQGLAKIEVKQGDVFNPDEHEAIAQIPAPDEAMKGKIIDVTEVGYKLGERVLRFPKVAVGQ
jgi:molecular chaperone GrpE